MTKQLIAGMAQKPTYFPCLVIVIDCEPALCSGSSSANRTATTLRLVKRVVLLSGDAVLCKDSIVVRSFTPALLFFAVMGRATRARVRRRSV
jgi:hypothetical protein